jgi:hypothetical protein
VSGNFPAHVSAESLLFLFFIGILLFLLLRSPCKNVKPYDNPFCGFE